MLGDGEFLFLFGSAPVKLMGQFYLKLWTIETCFQNLKKRGFNLESTHIKCLNKLKKLMALVSIAYSFCVSLGVHLWCAPYLGPLAKMDNGLNLDPHERQDQAQVYR